MKEREGKIYSLVLLLRPRRGPRTAVEILIAFIRGVSQSVRDLHNTVCVCNPDRKIDLHTENDMEGVKRWGGGDKVALERDVNNL